MKRYVTEMCNDVARMLEEIASSSPEHEKAALRAREFVLNDLSLYKRGHASEIEMISAVVYALNTMDQRD